MKFKSSQKINNRISPEQKFLNDTHMYCISFWIASNTKGISVQQPHLGLLSLDLLLGNANKIRSGTLTIVKTNNKYYGITCKHVIDIFDKINLAEKEKFSEKYSLNIDNLNDFKPYGLFTQNKKQIDLSSYLFLQPSSQYPDPKPDIVITELPENLIKKMNKKAINLDKNEIVPIDLSFGIAVGYPENLKNRKDIGDRSYIGMPHCIVTAEINGPPQRRFMLHSSVEEVIDRNFSGMSGGPIFWNKGNDFNLLGIIYESPNTKYSVFTQNDIVISGELATPIVVKNWISELFRNN